MIVVNFADFKDLIDALGGITVDVPKPIRSNRFDCPYATQARCAKWPGWRFHKGTQHMNGERALIYSRIRENLLDPSETDVTRGARQQAVMDATAAKFTSIGTLIGLPFNGGSLVKPLTTDLTAGQLVQLGWVKFRASSASSVHCRLGGDLGGGGSGSPSEDNPATIAMFLGKSAPQPPTGPVQPGLRHRSHAAVAPSAARPPARLGNLVEPARLHVVDEASDAPLLRDERARLDAFDRLPDVDLEIAERLRVPSRFDAGLLVQLTVKRFVAERDHAAVRVVDQDDLGRAEEPLRDCQRADRVVGRDTAGVADHMRLAFMQPEQPVHVQSSVHGYASTATCFAGGSGRSPRSNSFA